MVVSKVHMYMDSDADLWFALTSGIFLHKAARQEPIFLGGELSEWWDVDPFPTLEGLLSEWDRCGGVNGTNRVDMPEDIVSKLTGFLLALEMHMVGTARDVGPLLDPVNENLSQFRALLEGIQKIALA